MGQWMSQASQKAPLGKPPARQPQRQHAVCALFPQASWFRALVLDFPQTGEIERRCEHPRGPERSDRLPIPSRVKKLSIGTRALAVQPGHKSRGHPTLPARGKTTFLRRLHCESTLRLHVETETVPTQHAWQKPSARRGRRIDSNKRSSGRSSPLKSEQCKTLSWPGL